MVDNVGWKMRGIDLPIRITNVPFGTVRKTGQKKKSCFQGFSQSTGKPKPVFFNATRGGSVEAQDQMEWVYLHSGPETSGYKPKPVFRKP